MSTLIRIGSGLLLAICVIGLHSCTSPETGVLSGTVQGGAGETLSLQIAGANGLETLSTTTIAEDGSFSFKPSPGLPAKDYYYLSLGNQNFVSFIADSSQSIQFQLKGENLLDGAVITGNSESEQLSQFYAEVIPMQTEIQAIQEALRDPQMDNAVRGDKKKRYSELQTEMRKSCAKFIREHPQSPASLEALSGLNVNQSLQSYEAVVAALKPSFSHSTRYQLTAQQLEKAKKEAVIRQQQAGRQQPSNMPQVGDAAPEIEMENLSGAKFKLSDLKGKVVLVDFWASWCGPCRRENPNVVAAYDKYHDKGFEVFSVSLDSNKPKWEKAIQQDGLKWDYHVSDLKGWKNAAAQAWDVHSIPAAFLLDQNGVVVGSKLRGPQLEMKLEELLGS